MGSFRVQIETLTYPVFALKNNVVYTAKKTEVVNFGIQTVTLQPAYPERSKRDKQIPALRGALYGEGQRDALQAHSRIP